MGKSKRVMIHSSRNVTHVCVYEVGNEECMICGAESKAAGQKPLVIVKPAYAVAAEQLKHANLPMSKKDWKSKPQSHRLVCVCLICLGLSSGVSIIAWFMASFDVDECRAWGDDAVCSRLANCTNHDDAYTCKCLPGFKGTGDADVEDYLGDGGSVGCVDVDECAVAPPSVPDRGGMAAAPPPPPACAEPKVCVNHAGSYTCMDP